MQKYLHKAASDVNSSHSLNLVTCRCLLRLGVVSAAEVVLGSSGQKGNLSLHLKEFYVPYFRKKK